MSMIGDFEVSSGSPCSPVKGGFCLSVIGNQRDQGHGPRDLGPEMTKDQQSWVGQSLGGLMHTWIPVSEKRVGG